MSFLYQYWIVYAGAFEALNKVCPLSPSQVLFPARSVADSLTTQATERGTLSARMAAKESGPALFVGNLCGNGTSLLPSTFNSYFEILTNPTKKRALTLPLLY